MKNQIPNETSLTDQARTGSVDSFEQIVRTHQRLVRAFLVRHVGDQQVADDLVNAGTGADRISGGDGSDILIGGRGVDDITGNGDQDLLAAGQVDLTDGQLRLIGREWLSGNSYSDRVDNISGVGDENAGRNNGDAFLLPITSDRTIRDDENVDTLTGNAGRDLFFADFDSDIIEGRIQAEDQIDLR